MGRDGNRLPDEAPLLAFVSLVLPAIAMGNCVVAVPSATHPLSATDFYSVLDTSDVPGRRGQYRHGRIERARRQRSPNTMGSTLSGTSATPTGRRRSRPLSSGNLKATWVASSALDWPTSEGREFLRRATQSQEHLDALRRVMRFKGRPRPRPPLGRHGQQDRTPPATAAARLPPTLPLAPPTASRRPQGRRKARAGSAPRPATGRRRSNAPIRRPSASGSASSLRARDRRRFPVRVARRDRGSDHAAAAPVEERRLKPDPAGAGRVSEGSGDARLDDVRRGRVAGPRCSGR